MSTSLYVIPMATAGLKNPITPCPGFAKKRLADWKIDLLFLCFYGCTYCSSNFGNNMRCRSGRVAKSLGIDPKIEFSTTCISFEQDDLICRLRWQLDHLPSEFGENETIIVSMLTDPFSPPVRESGFTRKVLELLLNRTAFRIRILTKWAVGLDRNWLDYLAVHRDRFVVGMSCGSLDDSFSRAVELYTSKPSSRVRAFEALRERGVPVYAMFCPILPGAHEPAEVARLVDAFNPAHPLVETVWAEPFNDRRTANAVLSGLRDAGHPWSEPFADIFGSDSPKAAWSRYATDLLLALRAKAMAGGWLRKLHFLLYESAITAEDAARVGNLDGILLQSVTKDGSSKNRHLHDMQRLSEATR